MSSFNKVFFFGLIALSIVGCQKDPQPYLTQNTELGQYLFFDKALSYDGSTSCASCHDPQLAFTDGYEVSINSMADPLTFNAPSLLNLQNYTFLSWHDRSITDLTTQLRRPLFSNTPVEHGLHIDSIEIYNDLEEKYRRLLKDPELNIDSPTIIHHLVSYIKKLQSRNSPYDQSIQSNNSKMISKEATLGEKTFKNHCDNCHGGLDFNQAQKGMQESLNYRIPSLRNISITAPYMHDGQIRTLGEAIDHHSSFSDEDHLASLSQKDKSNLIHFLYSLTDTSYLQQPLFQNPLTSTYQ